MPTVYPRLANYFLKWEISDAEARELAKWNLLILDMDVQENSRPQLAKIRALNPQIIILAYVSSQEMLNGVEYYDNGYLRQELKKNIIDGWWLKDTSGRGVSVWPNTTMLNLSDAAETDYCRNLSSIIFRPAVCGMGYFMTTFGATFLG